MKEKRGIPRDQQIRELLSVYHTMTHQPHESVADFTHRFSETGNMNLRNLFQEFIRPPAKKSNLYLQRNFERTRFQRIQI